MKLAVWIKIAAQIPIGLLAVSSLLTGIIYMISGDPNGLLPLCGGVFFGILMRFAWWRPRHTGVMLMLLSLMLWAVFRGSLDGNNPGERDGALILALPVTITGILSYISTWINYNP